MGSKISQTIQWHELTEAILSENYNSSHLSNQYFIRLLTVLKDKKSTPIDKLLAYRDALCSYQAFTIDDLAKLPLTIRENSALCKVLGLQIDSLGKYISLMPSGISVITMEELSPVYRLEKRRHVKPVQIDPSLFARLNNDAYTHYQGAAQKMAVRVALMSQQDDTLIINLPTGVGKTLVAHALAAFSKEKELTLVVVPTTGLAIEQGNRAKKMLKNMGMDQASHYFWHGEQEHQIQNDIKQRIREGKQRILFSSPESVCRSLLPTLFDAAENGRIANIIVDEAHLVEQWGVTFRPDFQILSALIHALRTISPSGIRSVLMSATFTNHSIEVLRDLFSEKGCNPIEVHGSFLRPEIQYKVKSLRDSLEHEEAVLQAIIELPKPLIIYAIEVGEANDIANYLEEFGVSRISLFTGETGSNEREKILKQWSDNELDIIVATSAFGVGMDKGNVRSILHTAVPENLDRFYQEVGRSGRDGLASQSLLVYQDKSFNTARTLNNARIISVELGIERWKILWNSGKALGNGDKLIDVRQIHRHLHRSSDSNEEWNWRTLLLMRRAGLIDIRFSKPEPPEWDASMSQEEFNALRSNYYDEYYRQIRVSPLVDNHLDLSCWESKVSAQRKKEKLDRYQGFDTLKNWILNNDTECFASKLTAYYTINKREPEQVCAGCPYCQKKQNYNNHSPTLGELVFVKNLPSYDAWNANLSTMKLHQGIYYDPELNKRPRSLMRGWEPWITSLLENKTVLALRTDEDHLAAFQKSLPKGLNLFWIFESLTNEIEQSSIWPELIIVPAKNQDIPNLGFEESPALLLAPKNLKSPCNPNRLWWLDDHHAIPLDHFLLSISHGYH